MFARLFHSVVASVAEERERWVLWLPVGMGAGIVTYFALTWEPPSWSGPAGLALGVVILRWGWRREALPVLAVGWMVTAWGLGLAACQIHTARVAAPMLTRLLGVVSVTGRVIGMEPQPGGARILLDTLQIANLPAEATPARVRVKLAGKFPRPPMGARVRLRAMLQPPPPPAEPGAYDFQRQAFYDRLGGVGVGMSAPELVEGAAPSLLDGLLLGMEAFRVALGDRVHASLTGPGAAVSEAMLNGQQTGIAPPVMDDFRASGLAHILSISGLHIALVAGLVFSAIRACLAAIEPVALRYPIKKWAAAAGLLAAFAYMLVVGAPVPTLRSVLMTGVVMLAMVVDRNPFNLRLLALAALVVLLQQPDSLLGPSFQMSFGAVAALIAAYEKLAPLLRRWERAWGLPGQMALYLAGIGLSSVIATLATLPFSLYHFQQIALYGVLSNMVAVPLTSFWIMPAALLTYLMMPLGLEEWPLLLLGWGVDALVAIAHATAALPGSLLRLPAMPDIGLAAVTLGGLWLVIWIGPWRWWGLVPVVLGLLSPLMAQRPDLLVAVDGGVVAVREAGGGLLLSRGNAARIAAETWNHRDGRNKAAGVFPAQGATKDGRLRCDSIGCLYVHGSHRVALVRDTLALQEDCRRATVLVSAVSVFHCPGPLVIDRTRLRRQGVHAVYLSGPEPRVVTVQSLRGERPWIPSQRH